MASPPRVTSIKSRSDFLRASAEGRKFVVSTFILIAGPLPPPAAGEVDLRFGLTVTRRLGNAVKRNRIRRRLREAFRAQAALARPGHDYVLIARDKALHCEYGALLRDLEFALARVHQAPLIKDEPPRPRRPKPKPKATPAA